MRAAQNEICMLGTYGQLYESVDEPKWELPRRVINSEVAAWRLGRRATNPRTEKQLIYEGGHQWYSGTAVALLNLE